MLLHAPARQEQRISDAGLFFPALSPCLAARVRFFLTRGHGETQADSLVVGLQLVWVALTQWLRWAARTVAPSSTGSWRRRRGPGAIPILHCEVRQGDAGQATASLSRVERHGL
jgi:hypothetical protein